MTSHDETVWSHANSDPIVHPDSAHLVDPEDDMPTVGYAGDFETTSIPAYEMVPPIAAGPATDYGVSGTPEPLPYAQLPHEEKHLSSTQTIDHPVVALQETTTEHFPIRDRRGTQDFGLMLLRIGLGIVLLAHGLSKLFGRGTEKGIEQFHNVIVQAGYQYADVLTYVGIGGLVFAGILLIIGLFTPVVSAGVLAYYLNEVLVRISQIPNHRWGFFLPDGYEYSLLIFTITLGIILAGPGCYGLDGDRRWARRPFIGSILLLVIGIGSGVGMWVFLNGSNPLG